jgi:RHS repeat-associated protein
MQKIDYKYNIGGWLTAINEPGSEFSEGDRFGMRLWYNLKPDDSEGYFNGNIAATAWSTPNYKNLQYVYTYNKLNRLTQAKFWGEGFRDTTNYFKVNYSYDANGNILRLERYGLNDSPRLDNITYGYYDDTNVLKYSSDPNGDAPYIDDFIGTYSGAGTYYEYDPNGNLIRDDYKRLTISYNDLNLPEELDFGSNNKILYFYNSTGEKMLRAIDSDSVADMNTYYFGPFVHEGTDGSSSSLKYIITPEGRILNKGTDTSPIWDWEYYLKDHLGNVRVVIAPTGEAGYSAVQQETHYYPYGMRMSQLSNSANSTNDYLFSSKQLESNFDLGWYSFGGRNNYDPALIIWRSIDPLADKYYAWSSFNYCLNNPLKFIDSDGTEVRIAQNIKNKISYKIFSTTPMGKLLDTRFRTGAMKDHTLSIGVKSWGGFSAYVVNGNSRTHIAKVTADQLKGDHKFEFDIATRGGTENSGIGAEILGHEAFLHGKSKMDAIQNLIESGIKGEDLAKALNEIGLSSQIIYNGEVQEGYTTGFGGADHAKIVTGEDTELQEYVKQAKSATSNEQIKYEIQKKYDEDKNRYENDAWIQWWIDNK